MMCTRIPSRLKIYFSLVVDGWKSFTFVALRLAIPQLVYKPLLHLACLLFILEQKSPFASLNLSDEYLLHGLAPSIVEETRIKESFLWKNSLLLIASSFLLVVMIQLFAEEEQSSIGCAMDSPSSCIKGENQEPIS